LVDLLPLGRLHFHSLPLLPDLLLLLINHKVIVNSSQWLVIGEDLKHFLANSWEDLLAVPALAHRLVLVQWVFDVDELCIWDVLDKEPLDIDRARPFTLLFPKLVVPDIGSNSIEHFGYAAKMLGLVDAEHEVDVGVTGSDVFDDVGNLLAAILAVTITVIILLFELAQIKVGLIQNLVAILRGTPNIVFDRLVHIFFREGFDDEEAGVALVA